MSKRKKFYGGGKIFNRNLKIFYFIWNDPSLTSQTMNLTVYQIGSLTNPIICTSTSTGAVGSLNCNVSAYSGRLKAEVRRTASPEKVFAQLIEEIKSTIISIGGGSLGLFIGAILLIVLAFIGIASPVLVIIFGMVALIPLWILGGINWAVLTAIAVIGGIVLHFMRRVA